MSNAGNRRTDRLNCNCCSFPTLPTRTGCPARATPPVTIGLSRTRSLGLTPLLQRTERARNLLPQRLPRHNVPVAARLSGTRSLGLLL